MTCDPLARTGLDPSSVLFLGVGILLVVAGAVLLIVAREHSRRRGITAVTLLIILVVVGVGPGVVPGSAHAAGTGCASADSSLVVTQTSLLDGLAPGIAPVPIAGLVANRTSDATFITAVEVEIISVTAGTGAPGGCTVEDFVLLDPLMMLDRPLDAWSSASFSGASIGFAQSAANQDACKGAIVGLLYTANPG